VIEEFLITPSPVAERTRVLTTILIVHTADRDRVSQRVRAHGGQVRHSSETGLLATFAAPGQAIRCAAAICDDAANHHAPASTGIHTGEVDLIGDHISGPSLEIAESIADHADNGEVLVSRSVKDLVVGSGTTFQERGCHSLIGTSETWPLFTVIAV
jgi:class 3 adenylate cyclase